MRAVVFGQSGMRKEDYLREVLAVATDNGNNFEIINLGQRMAEKDPQQRDPQSYPRLNVSEREMLRRWALESVISEIRDSADDYVINAHAVFRLETDISPAADYDLFQEFAPDVIVVLIDDFHFIQRNLENSAFRKLTPTSILDWRDAEINSAKILAQHLFRQKGSPSGDCKFYILGRGHHPRTLYRLLYERDERLRIYTSFAITGAEPEQEQKIREFKNRLSENHIVIDPFKLTERDILFHSNSMMEDLVEEVAGQADFERAYISLVENLRKVGLHPNLTVREELIPEEVLPGLIQMAYEPTEREKGQREDEYPEELFLPYSFPLDEIKSISAAIDGQIITRDYMLIDQSEIVCALLKWDDLLNKPDLSAGSQSELTYAKLTGKDRLVVAEGAKKTKMSPWITEHTSEFFATLEDLEEALNRRQEEKKIVNI